MSGGLQEACVWSPSVGTRIENQAPRGKKTGVRGVIWSPFAGAGTGG